MRLQRHVSRVHSDERGQVTAYFVGISILLFAIMAFSFDIGLLHLQRRTVQNSVDPSVLAGAAYIERCPLAGTGQSPLTVADDFANRNLGVGSNFSSGDDVQTALSTFHVENDVGSADWTSVKARVDRAQGYIFGRFLGLVGANVPAEAEAVCGAISEGNICPFWIQGDKNQTTCL